VQDSIEARYMTCRPTLGTVLARRSNERLVSIEEGKSPVNRRDWIHSRGRADGTKLDLAINVFSCIHVSRFST
jgi:hypothetical protein